MAMNSDGTVVKRTEPVNKGTNTTAHKPGVAQGLPRGAGGAKVDNSTKMRPVARKQR